MVYKPREDSLLLQKWVKKVVKPNDTVLDMGSGSGIQAATAHEITNNVTAVDIDLKAIEHIKKEHPNIKVIQSDLFQNIPKETFDVIIFNPPYLPEDEQESLKDQALVGGKEGHEILEEFLKQAFEHLKSEGKILVLFSSLTGNILEITKKKGYKSKKLDEEKYFFEKMYVYKLSK